MTEPLTLSWDAPKPRDWARFMAEAGPAPLEQAHAYGEAVAAVSRWTVRRAVLRRGARTVALAQFFERRFGPVRVSRLLRGPVFAAACTEAERLEAAALLGRTFRPWRGDLLFWTPEQEVGAAAEALRRAAGKKPMLTGYSSILVDLSRPEAALRDDMDQQFRRSLRKAAQSGMKLEATRSGAGLDWLLGLHEAERLRRRMVAPSAGLARALLAALPAKQDALALVARDGSTPLAGMLFLRHGSTATYYLGATTAEGRTARAHHLILWQGALRLKQEGVRWLDLGGLNTDTMRGVAGFKLGFGGRLFTLAGTWF